LHGLTLSKKFSSLSVYGVKLHLICATNRMPIPYELTPANVADRSLTQELLAEATLGDGVTRKLLEDLAYRSQELEEELIEWGICCLAVKPARGGRG
jgi:DDE family transposase